MISQSPLCRLGTAHPQAVDAVFRKILRQPHFIWAKRGWARYENESSGTKNTKRVRTLP
jgi:hypothetical protein